MAPATRGSNKRKRDDCSPLDGAEDVDENSPCIELTTGVARSRKEKRMSEMWRNNSLCDIEIVVENETFAAHRNILAASSDYMHALLSENRFKDSAQSTIALSEISAASFHLVLEWLYEGKCEVTESGLTDLLEVSSRLQCVDLIDKLQEVLSARLKTQNCISMWNVAERMQLPKLAKAAKTKVLNRFDELIATQDFKSLAVSQFSALIESDELVAGNEEVVFESLISWAKAQQTRPTTEELGALFENVRFPLMSEDFITANVETEKVFRENIMGVWSLARGLKEKLHEKETKNTQQRRGVVAKWEDFNVGINVRIKDNLGLVTELCNRPAPAADISDGWLEEMKDFIGREDKVSQRCIPDRSIRLFDFYWPFDALDIVN